MQNVAAVVLETVEQLIIRVFDQLGGRRLVCAAVTGSYTAAQKSFNALPVCGRGEPPASNYLHLLLLLITTVVVVVVVSIIIICSSNHSVVVEESVTVHVFLNTASCMCWYTMIQWFLCCMC